MSGPSGSGAATQIYSRKFDARFFDLPVNLQKRIQGKIDQMGRRLLNFPHYRMEGMDTYRLRVGDYRVITKSTKQPTNSFSSRWDTGAIFTSNRKESAVADGD